MIFLISVDFLSVCLCAQSCLTLCSPMNCSPPGSSVHGNFQARILEWVAISFSRGSSQPRDRTCVSCLCLKLAGRFFTATDLWSLWLFLQSPWFFFSWLTFQFSWVTQLCPTFVTPWRAAYQASLSITNSRSLLKLMSIELVMPSNHLILCCPLLLPPSIFPSSRVFSNESVFASGGQSIRVSG